MEERRISYDGESFGEEKSLGKWGDEDKGRRRIKYKKKDEIVLERTR